LVQHQARRGNIEIRNSYVEVAGKRKVKSTKTHQMRRVALDSETVALLRAHKEWSTTALDKVGVELTDEMFVFMSDRKFASAERKYSRPKDATQPYSPRLDLASLQANDRQVGE
jgi:hypothetical protein